MQIDMKINDEKVHAEVRPVYTGRGDFLGWTVNAEGCTESLTVHPVRPEDENPYAPPKEIRYVPPGKALARDCMPDPAVETPGERLQSFNKIARDVGCILTFPYGRKVNGKYPIVQPLYSQANQANPVDRMLSIEEAAEYARVSPRTIRTWIHESDGDRPMLPGVTKYGRKCRIPQSSLDPYRKAKKATRRPTAKPKKSAPRKRVKREP